MTEQPLNKVLLYSDTRHRVHDYIRSIVGVTPPPRTSSSEQVRKLEWCRPRMD